MLNKVDINPKAGVKFNVIIHFLDIVLGMRGENMKRAFTLIELMIVVAIIAIIAAIAIPSLLQSRIASQDTATMSSLKAMITANQTFNTQNHGQSITVDPYFGYCRATIDLYEAEIETVDGPQKVRNIDRALCAADGQNGNSSGYYFRYSVCSQALKDGMQNITGYMIVAWPETVGRTGSKVFFVTENGTLYWRAATAADEGEEPPITELPSQDELDANWRMQAE